MKLGQYNELNAARVTANGFYLEDEEGNEVLLPNNYVDENLAIGDSIEVFVYKDSEDRVVATTEHPELTLHEFAYLEVKSVEHFGAFVDWGLLKDLLVPKREQAVDLVKGRSYVVYMFIDKETDRLVGSTKINRALSQEDIEVEEGEQVELLVYASTDLGFKVVVNQKHEGLIYHNEVFQQVRVGDRLRGYVKKVREDNKIDITLQKEGYAKVESSSDVILIKLKNKGGFIPLNDKSDPQDITDTFAMSKKTFKKAIGGLYRERLITIEPDGIHLVKSEDE